MDGHTISYLWDRIHSIFSGAGKFCLAHGLRQLGRDDVKNSLFQTLPRKTPTDVRRSPLCDVNAINEKNDERYLIILMSQVRKIIKRWSPMQTEKSQPSGQRLMPEARSTALPALSVQPWIGTFHSASETNYRFYFSPDGCMVWIEKSVTRVTDRHHEACRVMPNSDPEWQIFLSTPYTHDRYFFLHTFWFNTLDFQRRTCYKVKFFR